MAAAACADPELDVEDEGSEEEEEATPSYPLEVIYCGGMFTSVSIFNVVDDLKERACVFLFFILVFNNSPICVSSVVVVVIAVCTLPVEVRLGLLLVSLIYFDNFEGNVSFQVLCRCMTRCILHSERVQCNNIGSRFTLLF